MEEIKYTDEVKQDKDLGCKVRVRHIDKLPDSIERNLEKGIQNKEEGVNFNQFLKKISDGRYPCYFNLNHLVNAFSNGSLPTPYHKIDGGLFVCDYENVFFSSLINIPKDKREKLLMLYVFGPKNPRFREYLKEIRKSAEQIEGNDFFKHFLPLDTSKEEIIEYIKSNPDAKITYLTANDPKKAIEEDGTDILFTSIAFPFSIIKFNHRGDRGALEAISVFYSGQALTGVGGDWGGRIELEPNKYSPEVYKTFNYRFGDLAELVLDLDKREVTFFNEE